MKTLPLKQSANLLIQTSKLTSHSEKIKRYPRFESVVAAIEYLDANFGREYWTNNLLFGEIYILTAMCIVHKGLNVYCENKVQMFFFNGIKDNIEATHLIKLNVLDNINERFL